MIQGNRIRQVREQRALSQDALGKLVAKDAHYISKVERGILTSMTTTTLERLVQALHVSSDYLLGLSDAVGDPRPATNGAPPRRRTAAARATNGTRTAPPPAPAQETQAGAQQAAALTGPLPLCAHCGTPMPPRADGQGFACAGCRYMVPR